MCEHDLLIVVEEFFSFIEFYLFLSVSNNSCPLPSEELIQLQDLVWFSTYCYPNFFRYPNLYCKESLEILDLFLAAESQEVRGLCLVLST